MDLLDRLLKHDTWTTGQLLEICASLPDEQLDRDFDMGHRTLRRTLSHIIRNMEVWSALMASRPISEDADQTVPGMAKRLSDASEQLYRVARHVADHEEWDQQWRDDLDDPPRMKSYGSAIAHVITHSMHHRAQLLYMLRLCGVQDLPEGDVFSWQAGSAAEQEKQA